MLSFPTSYVVSILFHSFGKYMYYSMLFIKIYYIDIKLSKCVIILKCVATYGRSDLFDGCSLDGRKMPPLHRLNYPAH